MLRDRAGLTLVEYIVGAAIVIALAGAALYAVFEKLGQKIQDVNNSI